MKANEKLQIMLTTALNEIKKDGFCWINLTDNCTIFCNQNYADINLKLGNNIKIQLTFLVKDESEE